MAGVSSVGARLKYQCGIAMKSQRSQHATGLGGQYTEGHFQIGDGLFKVRMLIESLPQAAQDAMRLGHMFGCLLFLAIFGS
jgi:hypothetical protein